VVTFRSVTENASDLSEKVKESVGDFSKVAGRKLEAARDETSGALHTAAASVRKSSAALRNLGTRAADRLDATAGFVEDCSLKSVRASLRKLTREHTTACLVGAAAIGFFAGSMIGRAAASGRTVREND
jgi:ElaB/YqjD/DUF883 family membrane-anchored ribosome-binding protein